MAKKFPDFNLKPNLSDYDFLVGYDQSGSFEIRTTIADLITVTKDLQLKSFVANNSANWNSVYSTVSSLSSIWNSVYSSFNNLSSNFYSNYVTVCGLSANWNSVYSNVNNLSSSWNSVYSSFNNLSSNFYSNYVTVCGLSAKWNSVYSNVNNLSSSWNSVYSTVCSLSTNWNSVYSSFNSNSATYATILFTNNKFLPLSGGKITGNLEVVNNLSAANVKFSGRIEEGSNTKALGNSSHAEGFETIASGDSSHASGYRTIASGAQSFTIGIGTSATTSQSFAGGTYSVVKDRDFGFSFGRSNVVTHDTAVALGGNSNLASGPRSHAHGNQTIASGYESLTEGTKTGTGNRVPFQSYNATTKTFTFSPENSAIFFGEFFGNLQITLKGCITGNDSFHDGTFFYVQVQPNSLAARTPFNTLSALRVYYDDGVYGVDITSDIGSGKGWLQNGSGWESHAEGFESVASGFRCSHAEGYQTLASGNLGSHAEGNTTIASGQFGSHAEGNTTIASGQYGSHAEGYNTTASGQSSHAEGRFSEAKGVASHAAGFGATAAQNYTYAWSDGNLGTLTKNISTTRPGQYMISASGGMFIPSNVGIGIDAYSSGLSGNKLTVFGNISASGTICDVVASKPLTVSSLASAVVNMVYLSQATYTGLAVKDPSTVYIII